MGQTFKNFYEDSFRTHCHIIAELVAHYNETYLVPPLNIFQFFYDLIVNRKKYFNVFKGSEDDFVDSLEPKEIIFQKIVLIFKQENKVNNDEFWINEKFLYSWTGVEGAGGGDDDDD